MATSPSSVATRLADSVDRVRSCLSCAPSIAVVLGSGLGELADSIQQPVVIPYSDIPGCRHSSAAGHRGQLVVGRLESTTVIAMAGRLHRYEGWTNDDVVFPVRLMAALGVSSLVVSNAAGAVNPKLQVGDIVVIRDHINMIGGTFAWPPDRAVPGLMRRRDLYDPDMSRMAMRVGVQLGFNASAGTYLATLGPNYETRSEYRMMRRMGADVVGMSTIPEVLAAAHAGLRVLGLSMVSNVAIPDQPIKADHSEVLEAGRSAAVKMEAIVREVVRCTGPNVPPD